MARQAALLAAVRFAVAQHAAPGFGASITGILPQLGVLAAYAAVLLTLASWRLRRVLAG